jgi:hypothetical protein
MKLNLNRIGAFFVGVGSAASILTTFMSRAEASIINSIDFNTNSGYSLGAVNGQNPSDLGFSGAWAEQNGATDFQILNGGLTTLVSGNIASIDGGDARIAENGNGSFRIERNVTGFSGTETQLWFRWVLQPTTNSVSFIDFTGLGIGFGVSPSNFIAYGGTTTGSGTLTLNAPNLVVGQILMDRTTGGTDRFRLWTNPTSYQDLVNGTNFNSETVGNFINGSASFSRLRLNWENSRMQGDSFILGTELSDVVKAKATPEPSTIGSLIGIGLFGFFARRRKISLLP